MGQIGNTLVKQFSEAVDEFARFVEQCPDGQWKAKCGAEGWTVAQTAQHVSGQFTLEMEYITAAANGAGYPAYTWDEVNAKNDGRAAANASATKDEVLAELRKGASWVSEYVGGLSDDQLTQTRPLPLAGGAEVNVQTLIEGGVLIDHVRGHLASMRAAV